MVPFLLNGVVMQGKANTSVKNNTSVSVLAGDEKISHSVVGKNGQSASVICVLLSIKKRLIAPFLKHTMYTSSSSKLALSVFSLLRIENYSKLCNSVLFQHKSIS